MYSFPSTSQILPPAARSTKKGSPPTLRSARTGELTPPGTHLCASAKSLDEREVIGTQKTSNAQRSTPNIQFRSPCIMNPSAIWPAKPRIEAPALKQSKIGNLESKMKKAG